MSRELICSILELAPEAWPPDHYTLIGLSPDQANAAAVEARVQELSTRLRPYQLAHPDEVTDAMNRLAQALVCLTDPEARRAYDVLRVPPTHTPMPAVDVIPTPELQHPPESLAESQRAARRSIYRRLVVARRVKTAWAELSRWIEHPEKKIEQLVDAADFVRAIWSVRNCAAHPSAPAFDPPSPGFRIVALARQPDFLRQFRRMSSDKRAALATDYRAGATILDEQWATLRSVLGPRSKTFRSFRKAQRFLCGKGLELMLIAVGLAALAIAFWRQTALQP
jgi:hypothetical protein